MKQVPKTLEEIRNMTDDFLIPAQIAPILGCDPNHLRRQARCNPDLLGFPVVVLGKNNSRLKIPRLAFIRFMEGTQNVV